MDRGGTNCLVLLFFRNPVRVVPQGDNLVICPADGVVSLIQEVTPPTEMGLGDQPLTRVSVFMNVFNCHVNRACIDGTVTNVTYHHGKFLNASLDKASEHNERNSITITREDGTALVSHKSQVSLRVVSSASWRRATPSQRVIGLVLFDLVVDSISTCLRMLRQRFVWDKPWLPARRCWRD